MKMILAATRPNEEIYFITDPDGPNDGVSVSSGTIRRIPFWSYVYRYPVEQLQSNDFLKDLWTQSSSAKKWTDRYMNRAEALPTDLLEPIKPFLLEVPPETPSKPAEDFMDLGQPKKASDKGTKPETKARNIPGRSRVGRGFAGAKRGSKRTALALEPYDPDARDADGDGIVQEGTAWERPDGGRIIDALGREIRRGRQSGFRPTGIRVVDVDGNDIDYKPTYDGGRAGTIGGSTVPQVRPSVKPPAALSPAKKPSAKKPAKKKPAKKPPKPKKKTPLGEHGAESLKERGVPTVRERFRAAAAPPPPPEPKKPEPEKPDAPKPEAPNKPKTQAIVPKSENATRLNTYRQQFQDMVFDWINQRDDSWKKVDGLRVRKYGEDGPQRTVSIDVTRSGPDGPAKAKMSTAKMIADGWADRGIDPSEELKSNYKVIINKENGEVSLAYVGERKTDIDVLSGWKGKGDWYEVDEKDDRHRDLFNQAVASVLVGHWAGNQTNEVDKGIKRLFGGTYKEREAFLTRGGGAVGDDIAESFVEIMYEDTQKMFASMGIKEVQLHRGMALDYESSHGKAVAAKISEIVEAASEEQIDEWSREGLKFKMEKVRTELRAANSFSSDPFVADQFAEGEDEGPPIGVFSGAVPVERILATPATGIGCLNEDEMVVIGGEDTDLEVEIQVNDLQRVLRSIKFFAQ